MLKLSLVLVACVSLPVSARELLKSRLEILEEPASSLPSPSRDTSALEVLEEPASSLPSSGRDASARLEVLEEPDSSLSSSITAQSGSSSSSSVQSGLHKRCQSSSRCFYSTIPAYDQNTQELEDFIARASKDSNYVAKGLCVPTSAAMLLKAVLDERDPATALNSSFLQNFQYNSAEKNIYDMGGILKTNWKDGGTKVTQYNDRFNGLFSKTKPKVGLKFYKDGRWLGRADISNSDMISEIRKNKYGFFIAVSRHQKNERKILGAKIVWYPRYSGHALVVKGFDGDRLHIQDPWGVDYFARIKQSKFKVVALGLGSKHTYFEAINPSGGGWMHRYSDQKFRLILDELSGISLD